MEPEWNSNPNFDDAQMLGLRNLTSYLSLNNLDCNKLCYTVDDLLKKSNANPQNSFLCLEIKTLIDN